MIFFIIRQLFINPCLPSDISHSPIIVKEKHKFNDYLKEDWNWLNKRLLGYQSFSNCDTLGGKKRKRQNLQTCTANALISNHWPKNTLIIATLFLELTCSRCISETQKQKIKQLDRRYPLHCLLTKANDKAYLEEEIKRKFISREFSITHNSYQLILM